ncbi:MAG: ABC transporter ATP-binding protein/permease, partial [Caulobacteraceae bacterium]|nr:ABC transporter ATP-binding protein/permease [Caulobacter sp.]
MPPPHRLAAQLATLARGLTGAPERWTLAWLAVAVVVVLVLTAAAQVGLNAWNAPFYNAISARDIGGFLHELVVFFALAAALLVLNVVQMWLNLTLQLKLRAGLMHDLLDLWLKPLRAFRLAHGGVLGVNPDQRLHEDTRHLTELTATLAIGLLQASILLCVFIVVLWRLSAGFSFMVSGHT